MTRKIVALTLDIILFVFLILVLSKAFAGDVSFGLDKTENSLGLTASETNFFDKSTQFKRYGTGSFRTVLGNSSGVRIQSQGGFVLSHTGNLQSDPFNLFVGLGMGNFAGNLTTKKEEQDYYMFYPGIDGGFFLNLPGKAFLTWSLKGGETFGNLYSRELFTPKMCSYYGNQMFLKTPIFDLGYEKVWFGYNKADWLENQMVIFTLPRENWEREKQIIFKRQLLNKGWNTDESLALMFTREMF